VELAVDQFHRLHAFFGVVSEELELASDHRDRRAELVSRVVDEATLRGKRLLEPVEHLVEGPGEATDLVVTLHWYPLAQIGFGDVERGLADETDRPQHVPGGDPGDHG